MPRTTIGNLWVLPKRPCTTWTSNPWINSRGPTAGLESALQSTAYLSTHDGEQPNGSTSTAERSRQEKKQQKVAFNAWEDEGGSLAASSRERQ